VDVGPGGAAAASSSASISTEATMTEAEQTHSGQGQLRALAEQLPTRGELAGYRLTELTFEQEQHRRGAALQFVLAAANCRAQNYRLPALDAVRCRRLLGWASPAVPPAAALAAGLACVELYKLVRPASSSSESSSSAAPTVRCPYAPAIVQH
jgi:ubiquitin-activating enzyme E1